MLRTTPTGQGGARESLKTKEGCVLGKNPAFTLEHQEAQGLAGSNIAVGSALEEIERSNSSLSP